MKYNYEFDMKYTDNPYIDLLVNCVKILGMNCVVKNENEALHYEDLRSSTESGKLFKYKAGYWNESKDGFFSEDTYMEWNSYYRMLNGLPPAYTEDEEKAYIESAGLGDDAYEYDGIAWVVPDLISKYYIDMSQYTDMIPDTMPSLSLEGKYAHELTDEELAMVESAGILDQMKEDYQDSHYNYLYHLGDKKVDFYTARKAVNFSLLYLPSLNTFDIIEHKFRRMFDRNRKYTLATVYSEAYRFMSYHYDAFIVILIIIQTMVDMIMEVQEYIINKDVFDSRTIRYLFESYGIDYYKEIPVKYQIRIIKNVNTLLKYKSSNRNITDIITLFDNPDITVYTYYLMKIKDVHKSDFRYYEYADVNPKYGTNTVYYLGNPDDKSNNKYPLTDYPYDSNDQDFIEAYIIKKVYSGGTEYYESPVVDLYINFISNYLDSVEWFWGDDNKESAVYTDRKSAHETEEQRAEYLTNLRNNLLEVLYGIINNNGISTTDDDNTTVVHPLSSIVLNRYNYRAIIYALCEFFGAFEDNSGSSGYDDFSTWIDENTDSDLEEYFYKDDDYYGDVNGNIYKLNTTVIYMDDSYRSDANTNNFNVNNYSLFNSTRFECNDTNDGTKYDEYTEIFRGSFVTFIQNNFINSDSRTVFEDIDSRYVGWIDMGYVDDPTAGVEVSTVGNDLIPIYNEAYIEFVVTEDQIGQEYFTKNYDLCFLRVPILDPNAYKVLEDTSARRSYDSITLDDPFWDGVSTFDLLTDDERDALHQSKKKEILNKEFTIERTKYIAVEASIDLVKMSYQLSYFMNMLYDRHIDEETLTLEVNNALATNPVKLSDLLTFAIALNFLYNGVEPDNIASDMEKNMMINGFNFDTDWTDIYNYLQNKHFIYNNYDNDELHDYTYVNEYGQEISVTDGYGMDPIERGYMSELYSTYFVYTGDNDHTTTTDLDIDSNIVGIYTGEPLGDYITDEEGREIYSNNREYYWTELYPNPKVGAFLSGRYEKCGDDESSCAYTEEFKEGMPSDFNTNDSFNFGYSDIWNINLKKSPVYDITTNDFETIDLTWETQYLDDDNNSHGLFLNTDILDKLDGADSDIERFNMIKKIYYSNTNLYDHLTYMMRTAESKRMYDIYNIVFESFMETRMNHEFYNLTDSDGNNIYEITDEDGNTNTYTIVTENRVILYDDSTDTQKIAGIDDIGDAVLYPLYQANPYRSDATSELFRFVNPGGTYTDCYFIGLDTGTIIGCLTDKTTGDYVLIDDYTGQIGHALIEPSDNDYIFEIAYKTVTYLQNVQDSSDIILIEEDEDGNIISSSTGTTIDGLAPKIASDYYEFLQYRNQELYSLLIDLKYNYSSLDEKRVRIEELCEYIVDALEEYFDKDEWKYIYNLIPTANIENIQNYILKMVIFFKSWKTQILDISVDYTIDDPWQNHVHILDDMYYNSKYDLLEKVRPKEFHHFGVTTTKKEKIRIGEKTEIRYTYYEPYTVEYGFGEKLYGHSFDFPALTSTLNKNDSVSVSESVEMSYVEMEEAEYDANGNLD